MLENVLAAAVVSAMWTVGPPQEHIASQQYFQCLDRSGGVTSNLRDCAGDEGDRQHREIKALYKQAMAGMDAAGKERMRDQERRWMKRHAAVCTARMDKNDGTAKLLAWDDCILYAHEKRIAALKALITKAPRTSSHP